MVANQKRAKGEWAREVLYWQAEVRLAQHTVQAATDKLRALEAERDGEAKGQRQQAPGTLAG